MSRVIGCFINISVGAEWTSLKSHSESILNKRGGHKPTFYRVADNRSAMTDFYFGKIMEAFYMY